MRRALFAAFCVTMASAFAPEGDVRVELQVTAVEGVAVYVDRGRGAGLTLGLRVRFFPPGAPPEEGAVEALAEGTARVSLDRPVSSVVVGTPGEVWVESGAEPALPWTRPPEQWADDAPLLGSGVAPAERRRSTLAGRTFLRGFWTRDDSNGERRSWSVRSGVNATWERAFGGPGRLHVGLEGSLRELEVGGVEQGETAQRLRVERLSWAVGGTREEAGRLEVGRFWHAEFPELGRLDGLELNWRTDAGHRVGASVGFLPEPTDALESGDDVATSAYALGSWAEGRRTLGVAYQKSWHRGAPDRDLVVARGRWRPSEETVLDASTWLDLRSVGAESTQDAELTQARASLTRRFGGTAGLSAFASRWSYPRFRRFEFERPSDEELAGDHVTRVGLEGWTGLGGDVVRLGARAERWEDEDAEGGSGELRLDLVGPWRGGDLAFALFATRQEGSEALGARVGVGQAAGAVLLRLDVELSDQEFLDRFGPHAQLSQGYLRAAFDLAPTGAWYFSLYAEQLFGDQLDARTLGFQISRSF